MDNIDNTHLLELIKKLKEEKSMEVQNQVISEVLKSRFLCPVILEDAPKGGGKIQIDRNTKIQFSIIKTQDGKSFLMAFTRDEEVHKWQKNKVQQSIIYTFEDYANIIVNSQGIDGFVIDPMGCNIVFTEDMIKEIKQNVTKETVVEKDTQVELGIPKDYPEELASKLQDVFRNIPEVKQAHLLLMTKEEELSYLVIVDAGGKEKEYFNTIATAAIPFLDKMPLNLLPANTEFGKRAMLDFEPFYVSVSAPQKEEEESTEEDSSQEQATE